MLTFTRGDTFSIKFQRKDCNGDVITEAPNTMYFTLKTRPSIKTYVLQKTLEDMHSDADGTWHITLQPEDTEGLSVGNYYFDIEVTTNSYVKTIAKDWIKLTEESTWKDNK